MTRNPHKKQFGPILIADDVDSINNRPDPKQEAITSEDKDLIDAESQLQILHSVTSRMLLNLPKRISKLLLIHHFNQIMSLMMSLFNMHTNLLQLELYKKES